MMTDRRSMGSWIILIFVAIVTLTLGGAASAEENAATSEAVGEEISTTPGNLAGYVLAAQAAPAMQESDAEQDPWEGFNDPVFRFNREVDRFVYKPLAIVWDAVLPDSFQRSLHNAIDNLSVVRRIVNNLFQGKPDRAGREFTRFAVNSTIGYAGLLDVAKDAFGIQQADEDFGQTLGVWGVKPGPYLIIPFVPPPFTVRDASGKVVDAVMNPMTWAVPFGANAGLLGTEIVNERSLYLTRYQQVEESVVDLYSAVRNAYLQRRAAAIRE